MAGTRAVRATRPKKQVGFRFDKQVLFLLDQIAEEKGVSMTDIVQQAIVDAGKELIKEAPTSEMRELIFSVPKKYL